MEIAFLWTLIHSLWIGVITAALTGVIVLCTKRSSPQLRYLLFCAVLGLFVIATLVLGWYQFAHIEPAKTALAPGKYPDVSLNITNADVPDHLFVGFNPIAKITFFINQYALWIFAIWLFFFAWKMIKFAGGLFYVQKLKSKAFFEGYEGYEEWKARLALLASKLGISREVRLLQSQKIKMPLTIGFLKPVILLPAGLFLQLPPGYIESILWHELAHIRRHDYFVNIIQKSIEAIFFFNPAAIWISGLIREEREACCDEVVLANVPQKVDYLSALLSFQEVEAPNTKLALTLAWSRNEFKSRLYRMMGMGNQQLSLREGLFLLTGIALLTVFTVMAQEPVKKLNANVKTAQTKPISTKNVKPTADRQTGEQKPSIKEPLKISEQQSATAEKRTQPALQVTTVADTINWIQYKLAKLQKADIQQKFSDLKVEKNHPFDNSTISADVEKVKTVLQALVSEGIVQNTASVDWFGLSTTELIVNGQKQAKALHEKLKEQTQVSDGHGLYYGPVKMIGQGFFLDKQDVAKL